ncbi:MAG TPA: EVE domain-containing protein [Candidatus Glassbacteria bacterium]|nr:EVE domain-containing protein [Candidatus Glassbacteria bacterium]
MNYWLFKCNEEMYRVRDRMEDPEHVITWPVTRYKEEIKAEDIVFLWVTGKDRGICGAFRVDQTPSEMVEIPKEQKFWTLKKHWNKKVSRVIGTIIHRVSPSFEGKMMKPEYLKGFPMLEDLPVFHGYQNHLNFKVSPKHGRKILNLFCQ